MTGTDSLDRWKRPESVLVLVHAAGGEVLLLQRADDPAFWQSVTGSLEAGETPLDTARRELREETGLALEPIDLRRSSTFEIRGLWRARYAPDVTHNLEHVFAARLDAPRDVTLCPEEHLACRWMPATEALALASSPTNRKAIRDVIVAAGIDMASGTHPSDGAGVAADAGEAAAAEGVDADGIASSGTAATAPDHGRRS